MGSISKGDSEAGGGRGPEKDAPYAYVTKGASDEGASGLAVNRPQFGLGSAAQLGKRLLLFLDEYEFASSKNASMTASDVLGGTGASFPYSCPPAVAAAIGEVFATNVVHCGIADRNMHPYGVIAAAPGVGKTRALLELKETLLCRCRPEDLQAPAQRAALAALQAGTNGEHVELLVITFNNGNDPCTIDMAVRAALNN